MTGAGAGSRACIRALFGIALFGIVVSASDLAAVGLTTYAEQLLDDKETEQIDMLDISDETLPAYQAAIRVMDAAFAFAPLRADLLRSQAVLQGRIDDWKRMLLYMRVSEGTYQDPPAESSASLGRATAALRLDPMGTETIFTAGQLFFAAGYPEEAKKQWLSAAAAYPVNSAVRFSSAMHLLMAGHAKDAQEQAVLLAKHDDSYRVAGDGLAADDEERCQTEGYRIRLENSYLMKAMEIAWKTSGGDMAAIEGMAPSNEDAREVLRLFKESKGLP